MEAAKTSAHYPVLPDRAVLWQALQEGVRENRWVLYLRGPNLAVGAQEMNDWPGTPRFEDAVEFWTYQAALDRGIYPRKKPTKDGSQPSALPLTPANTEGPLLAGQCPGTVHRRPGAVRSQRLARPQPAAAGHGPAGRVRDGAWAAWRKGDDEAFYTRETHRVRP